MAQSILGYASILALLSLATADSTTYPANTNTNCATSSDVNYQDTYYYDPNDTMDWGFYTQSTGTCDSGSYAHVHVVDPTGNDIDCGYTALDGQLHLTSCSNYPRGYMQEGQYTLYWETIPASGQYSWNQFNIVHSQSTVTAATVTQTVTTTPVALLTSTITATPTQTVYSSQTTVTSPSATLTNVVNVTPAPTTITTTSTSYYSVVNLKYVQTTTTAYTTAPCYRETITTDKTGKRTTSGSTKGTTSTTKKTANTTCSGWYCWLFRRDGSFSRDLVVRDDVPNTVGMPGPPSTTTITPAAVVSTVTAATATSTITSTTSAAAVTVTSANPTPTLTIYSGQAVQTTTVTASQITKSVVKTKVAVTTITSTSTLTYTTKSVTTPICTPSALKA